MKESPALVGRSPMFLTQVEQRSGEDDPWNTLVVKELRDSRAQHIHIADQRHSFHPMLIHVESQLMNLSRIEPNLVDDELRATFHFLLHFQKLWHHFPFKQFEVINHRADQELRLLKPLSPIAPAIPQHQSAIHLTEHRDQPD